MNTGGQAKGTNLSFYHADTYMLLSSSTLKAIGRHLDSVLEKNYTDELSLRDETTTTTNQQQHETGPDWYGGVRVGTELEVRLGSLKLPEYVYYSELQERSSSSFQSDEMAGGGTQQSPPMEHPKFEAHISPSEFRKLVNKQNSFDGWIAESNWYRTDDLMFDVFKLVTTNSSQTTSASAASSSKVKLKLGHKTKVRRSIGHNRTEWCVNEEALIVHPQMQSLINQYLLQLNQSSNQDSMNLDNNVPHEQERQQPMLSETGWNNLLIEICQASAALNEPLMNYLDIDQTVHPTEILKRSYAHRDASKRCLMIQKRVDDSYRDHSMVAVSEDVTATADYNKLPCEDGTFVATLKRSLLEATCASFAHPHGSNYRGEGEVDTTMADGGGGDAAVSLSESQIGRNMLMTRIITQFSPDRRMLKSGGIARNDAGSPSVNWYSCVGPRMWDLRLELSKESKVKVNVAQIFDVDNQSRYDFSAIVTPSTSSSAASDHLNSGMDITDSSTSSPAASGEKIHLKYGYSKDENTSSSSSDPLTQQSNGQNEYVSQFLGPSSTRMKYRKSWISGCRSICKTSVSPSSSEQQHPQTDEHQHDLLAVSESQMINFCCRDHMEACKRPVWRFDFTMVIAAKTPDACEELLIAALNSQDENGTTKGHDEDDKWLMVMSENAHSLEIEIECIDPLYLAMLIQLQHEQKQAATNDSAALPPLPPLNLGEELVKLLMQQVVRLSAVLGRTPPSGNMVEASPALPSYHYQRSLSPFLFTPVVMKIFE